MPRYNGNIMPKYICTGTRVMNKIFMSVFEGKMLALHICIKKWRFHAYPNSTQHHGSEFTNSNTWKQRQAAKTDQWIKPSASLCRTGSAVRGEWGTAIVWGQLRRHRPGHAHEEWDDIPAQHLRPGRQGQPRARRPGVGGAGGTEPWEKSRTRQWDRVSQSSGRVAFLEQPSITSLKRFFPEISSHLLITTSREFLFYFYYICLLVISLLHKLD